MHRAVLIAALLGFWIAAAVHAQPATVQVQSVGWSVPVSLSAASTGIVDVSLAVSEGGTAHVVWEDGGHLIHAFGVPTVGSLPSDIAYGEGPALTGGEGSAAHLAFAAVSGGQMDVCASDWTGSAWSLPVSVMPTDSDSLAPAVGRLGTQLAVVWAEATDLHDIYVATRTDAGPWIAAAVSGAAGNAPDICLDNRGAHVLFQDRDPITGKMDLWYTLGDGAGWSLPVSVSNSFDWDSHAGRVACLLGQTHATWQEATASGYQIQHATGSDLGWGTANVVSPSGDAFSPDLAVSDGALHVAWAQTGAVAYRPWSGGIWGTVETLSVSGYVLDVAVGAAPDGTMHLAWVELSANGTARVMYSWRSAGGSTATPTSTTTRTHTATTTRTATATPTRTPTATFTRTATTTATTTSTPAASFTVTATRTGTATRSYTPTATRSATVTATHTVEPTKTPSVTATATRVPASARWIFLPMVFRGIP